MDNNLLPVVIGLNIVDRVAVSFICLLPVKGQ